MLCDLCEKDMGIYAGFIIPKKHSEMKNHNKSEDFLFEDSREEFWKHVCLECLKDRRRVKHVKN